MARLLVFAFFLSVTLVSFGQHQQKAEFAKPTLSEKALKSYEKDPESAGVVLYEKGENYFEEVDRSIRLMKKIHVRMKVLDAKNFDASEVIIPYYHNSNSSEKIRALKAVTINGNVETFVSESSIFEVDETVNWKTKRFTFPAIQDGSILEYTYIIQSPYYFNFGDWKFQGKLPKIYTEFESKIPGNFKYKRELLGTHPLYINEIKLLKNCFSLEGISRSVADCDHGIYAMKNVPAYKEEKYMLSESNFISRIKYELVQTMDFNGSKTFYTKTWDDVDREFKSDKDLGKQLRKNTFFEDKISPKISSIADPLERAKAIYYSIQSHFTWNNKYAILSNIRVKEAYENRKGNSSEINLSLINMLNAAGLDAKAMLLSTRNNGIPSFTYPVMTDFNYAIAVVTIKDATYLLDATEKYTPFGIVPFRDLNVKGRVMDFKKGSFWMDILPNKRNLHYVNVTLSAKDDDTFLAKVNEAATGHIGIPKREEASLYGKSDIIKDKESKMQNVIIEELSFENVTNLELALKTSYSATVETELVSGNTYLYPYFFDRYFTENPFTSTQRSFPIDFGFPVANNYIVTIDLKEHYEIVQLPESKKITLPDNAGSCTTIYEEKNGVIQIRFNLKLDAYRLKKEGYSTIREFFSNALKFQNEEPIVLKKI